MLTAFLAHRYLLRRAALRAASSTSASIAVVARPRTFASLTSTSTTSAFRPHQRQWLAASQRRYNSDDADVSRPTEEAATETEEAAEEAAAGNPEVEPTNAEAESSTTSALDTASEAVSAVGAAAASAASAAFGTEPAQDDKKQFVGDNDSQTILYVGNLFYQTTEDQLRQEFSRFGNLVKTTIIRDPVGMSRGFGYVEYDSEEAASSAIMDMNQRVLDGRRMTVQFHKKREGREGRDGGRLRISRNKPNPPSKTLFIGNMSYEMSDRDLNELFRDVRNVLDVRVAIDRRTGQPRGFAHADFLDETSATKAMSMLQEKEVYGRRLRVDYTSASAGRT
ncbi:nucleic acid-binding protein [Diplodia corticola]|uniref:Nucleic acid-binding protein n=1 Tax=Diplodia corticola TaxID=236234 RepID=A0A1J9QPU6_9PEZI|nr:nucleic acid-binding protein [Diplodia corticola]OJD30950.1 nucleic acid-binding protein [Diplodia corticola]